MGDPAHVSENLPNKEERSGTTVTGVNRITRNVLASWLGYSVFVVGGFIMPRFIDREIGQHALGVWDFAWALVAYFGMVQADVVSAVSRYVARFAGVQDTEGVNRTVSSATCLLLLMGGVVLGLTAAAYAAVPHLFTSQLGDYLETGRWVIVLLGARLAVQIAFSAFGGILTGYHRWDLQNTIESGSYAVSVIGMLCMLFLGYGLVGLAAMTFLGQLLSSTVRVVVAYRVSPALCVGFREVRWSSVRELLAFGAKTMLGSVTQLQLHQATNIFILAYLGPSALAVYSRPRALVRHMTVILRKYAFVLGPSASSLHAAGQTDDLRKLLVDGTRTAAYIALPMILTLAIFGDLFLHIWMGSEYRNSALVVVMACGFSAAILQESIQAVLWGMNAHGRAGAMKLVAAVVGVVALIVVLGSFEGGLVDAALAVSAPWFLVNAVCIPLYACHLLGVRATYFFRATLLPPLLCTVPLVIALFASRLYFEGQPGLALVAGGVMGGLALSVPYWRYALSDKLKEEIARRITRRRGVSTATR